MPHRPLLVQFPSLYLEVKNNHLISVILALVDDFDAVAP